MHCSKSSAAAGKSTFVRLLEKHSDEWEIIPEPIAKWCNIQTAGDEYEVGAQDLGMQELPQPGSYAKIQLFLRVIPTIIPVGQALKL